MPPPGMLNAPPLALGQAAFVPSLMVPPLLPLEYNGGVPLATTTTSPAPLDQGRQGTCVVHAVTQVCAGMLRLRYAVPIPEQRMSDIMKTVCPSWAGNTVPDLCSQWNAKPPQLEDMSSKLVYVFRIECEKVPFSEACDVARRFSGTPSVCVRTRMHSRTDGPTHALAAFDVYPPDKELVAVNSWGADQPEVYIGVARYLGGWKLTPVLLSATEKGIPAPLPALTRHFQWRSAKREREVELGESLANAQVRITTLKSTLESKEKREAELTQSVAQVADGLAQAQAREAALKHCLEAKERISSLESTPSLAAIRAATQAATRAIYAYSAQPACGVEVLMWHGTDADVAACIQHDGHLRLPPELVQRDTFFGRGVYLTSSRAKAEAWARYRSERAHRGVPGAVVLVKARILRCKEFDMGTSEHGAYQYISLHSADSAYDDLGRSDIDIPGVEPVKDDPDCKPLIGARSWLDEGYDAQYVEIPNSFLQCSKGCSREFDKVILNSWRARMFGDELVLRNETNARYVRHEILADY